VTFGGVASGAGSRPEGPLGCRTRNDCDETVSGRSTLRGHERRLSHPSNANFHQIEVGRSVALLLEARGRLRKRKIEHAKPFRRAMTQTARAKAGCRRCRGKPGITRNSCSAPESVGILPSRRNRIRNSRRSWGAAGSCSCGTRSRTGKRQSTWFPAGRIHSVGVEQAAVSPAAI